MFIQTEATANPAVLKFLPGRVVLEQGSAEYADATAARASPLAQRLFAVEAVRRIAFGHDFITVTKDDGADWQLLKPAVLGVIMEHFVSGRPLLAEGGAGDALAQAVIDLIETRIKPAVEHAGGTVSLRQFAAGIATVEMGGAPASNPTFRNGIENMLRHYVPEVEEVQFVAGERKPVEFRTDRPGLASPEGIAIQALLEDEINPMVAAHGGAVSLVDVLEHKAYVRLQGGCHGCGMASVTLRHGIETTIMEKVPSIVEVLDVTDHAGGENPYYQA